MTMAEREQQSSQLSSSNQSSSAGGGGTSPTTLFSASYLAPAFMRRWRNSTLTARSGSTRSDASDRGGERGFQKVAGRKIPSVLRSGGDGYGGGYEGTTPVLAAGAAAGESPSSSNRLPPPVRPHGAPLDTTREHDDERSSPPTTVFVRPSPARTPVSTDNDVFSDSNEVQQHVRHPSQVPDLVGRSRPSLDESRGSRFTESI